MIIGESVKSESRPVDCRANKRGCSGGDTPKNQHPPLDEKSGSHPPEAGKRRRNFEILRQILVVFSKIICKKF